jgi:GT2 family glycosyltransferase
MSTSVAGALVLAVNYNSSAAAENLLASLAAVHAPMTIDVVMLDNSDREPLDAARAARAYADKPGLEVIRTPRNLGYFGAAAFGLERFLERSTAPEWVVVCNVDLTFDAGFFSALGACVGAGVIAPSILTLENGLDQNPYMLRRPLRMAAYQLLYAFDGIYALYELAVARRERRRSRRPTLSPRPTPVYAPHGACVVFSRAYFQAGGTLRHPAFLFGEELFVAETARGLGLPVRYEPSLRTSHQHQLSTSALPLTRRTGLAREAVRVLRRRYF